MNVVSMRGNIDPSYYRLLAGQQQGSLIGTFEAKHPSIAERLAAGKALREKVPRTSHASYEKGADRPDPVEIVIRQNATRIQKLVPVRYARMLASSFAFLRGSAAVMASDLSRTPVTGLAVAACGDMHVSNFGVYASAERTLVFGINDFDEVHPGPWEWDVKRLAASAAVAVRFMGGDDDEAQDAARACVRSYRKRIRRYAEMGYLEVWYDHIDDHAVLEALSPRVRRNAEKLLDKARAKGHIRSLDKLTEQVDGEPRIIEDIPLIVRETHTDHGVPIRAALDQMLGAYIGTLPIDRRRLLARYRIIDAARKVVGVGSVGTGCWVILLEGVDNEDPLFLQVKEAQPSVLAPYVDIAMDDRQRRPKGRGRPAGHPGLAGYLSRLGRGRRPALLRPPARRHEGQRQLHRRRRPGHRGLHRVLRPVWLGAGAGPRQIGRPGDDRGLLRRRRHARRRHCHVRAGLRPADR